MYTKKDACQDASLVKSMWRGRPRPCLGLVAEALLVAVGFHPLLALVLADLGLTTLFEAAHWC